VISPPAGSGVMGGEAARHPLYLRVRGSDTLPSSECRPVGARPQLVRAEAADTPREHPYGGCDA
jgi:hypothetical protein